MPPLKFILNITFDSSIEKIDLTYGSFTNTYTNSVSDEYISYEPGNDLYMDVTLKAGYSIDTTTLGTITGNRITIAAENINLNVTLNCTITTKSASSKLSIDLTTLPGWANLSAGNHTIKIKAKGTGYRDSELSVGVTVSKAASTVTLEAGTYKFKDILNITANTDITEKITATINTLTANNVYGSQKTIDTISVYRGIEQYGTVQIFNTEPFYNITGSEWKYMNENGEEFTATDTSKLRTIIFETDQQVSPEFYKWAITDGNLVKYEETYLLNTTLSMPSTATYYGLEGGYKIGDSIYDSICIGYNNGKELRIAWRDDSGDLMWDTLYNSNGWLSQSNRGLTLLKEPASAFLRWLQANSTQPV